MKGAGSDIARTSCGNQLAPQRGKKVRGFAVVWVHVGTGGPEERAEQFGIDLYVIPVTVADRDTGSRPSRIHGDLMPSTHVVQHFLDHLVRFGLGACDENPGGTGRLLPAEFDAAQRLTVGTDTQQANAGQEADGLATLESAQENLAHGCPPSSSLSPRSSSD